MRSRHDHIFEAIRAKIKNLAKNSIAPSREGDGRVSGENDPASGQVENEASGGWMGVPVTVTGVSVTSNDHENNSTNNHAWILPPPTVTPWSPKGGWRRAFFVVNAARRFRNYQDYLHTRESRGFVTPHAIERLRQRIATALTVMMTTVNLGDLTTELYQYRCSRVLIEKKVLKGEEEEEEENCIFFFWFS